MPKSVTERLYDIAKNTKTDLQADDALLTGIFRSKAKIPLIQVWNYILLFLTD